MFADGDVLRREAIFFDTSSSEQSALPRVIGCEYGIDGGVKCGQYSATSVAGVYAAGNITRDVLAIVAAAEGTKAGTWRTARPDDATHVRYGTWLRGWSAQMTGGRWMEGFATAVSGDGRKSGFLSRVAWRQRYRRGHVNDVINAEGGLLLALSLAAAQSSFADSRSFDSPRLLPFEG